MHRSEDVAALRRTRRYANNSEARLNPTLRALRDAARKPAELARRIGVPDTIFEALSRTISACSFGRCELRRYYVMAQPLAKMPRTRAGRGASIAVRRVSADDAVVDRFPRPRGEVMERFAAGSQCFIAESAGDLLGFVWLHFGPFADPEVCVTFTPSPADTTAWDFDLYVVPENRAGLAFFRMWETVGDYLLARGTRWSVSRVWSSNDESIRAHGRLGAYPVASACHFAVGSLAFTITARSPYIRRGRRGGAYSCMLVAANGGSARHYARFSR